MITLIFTTSKKQAKWAIQYKKTHPKEKITIFAPSVDSQLELLKASEDPFAYFMPIHFNKEYHTAYFWNLEKQAVEFAAEIIKKLAHANPILKNYLAVLQIPLEKLYLFILDTHAMHKKIEKIFNPAQYIFFTGEAQNNLFTKQFDLLKQFIAKEKVIIVPISSNILFSKFRDYRLLAKYTNFKLIQNYLHKTLFLKKSLITQIQNTDVLLFSAGKNLFFYHKLIQLLKSSKLKTKIITGEQSIEDEKLLLQKQMQFIAMDSFSNKLLKDMIKTETEEIKNVIEYSFTTKECKKIFTKFKSQKLVIALYKETKLMLLKSVEKHVRQLLLAQRIINTYKPKLVITTHDPGPSALPFVLEARKQNIVSLVLLHGWQDTILGVKHSSDHIALWSNYLVQWFQKNFKTQKKNIHRVGYPLFDNYFLKKLAFWQQKQKKLILHTPIKLSLLLTNYAPHNALQNKFLLEFFSFFARFQNEYMLSIRTHAGQTDQDIQTLADYCNISITLNPRVSLDDYITQSDVLLSWDTSAIMWCMLYGKPTFYCTPNWTLGYTPVQRFGGAWFVKGPTDLHQKIRRIQKNPAAVISLQKKQREYLKKVIEVLDGTSSMKHQQLIMKLLNNN